MKQQKHSKFKNSGILYELLVRTITSDILSGKPSPAINILKEHFSNSELGREYKLYNALTSGKTLDERKANLVIETTIDLYKKLNKSELRKQRYNVIREVKKHYDLVDFFKAKINNYKIYAAGFTLFEIASSSNFANPDTIVKNKVVLLEHLTSKSAKDETKDQLMEEYLNSDKGSRFLIYKALIERFNKKYTNLDNIQKDILREYINNISNTQALKEYINSQFIIFKKILKEQLSKIDDKTIKIKVSEIVNIIKPIAKNEVVKDDDVLSLLHYSELIKEIKEL